MPFFSTATSEDYFPYDPPPSRLQRWIATHVSWITGASIILGIGSVVLAV